MAHHVALIYPHQLYADHPAIAAADTVWLIEDPLFFSQYRFHRKKLILHRASMLALQERLTVSGRSVRYVRSHELPTSTAIGSLLVEAKVRHITFVDPCDDWLSQRLATVCRDHEIASTILPDPHS